MRLMCRVLIKKKRLQCTTKTVNLHVRLTQFVLEQVPCQLQQHNSSRLERTIFISNFAFRFTDLLMRTIKLCSALFDVIIDACCHKQYLLMR